MSMSETAVTESSTAIPEMEASRGPLVNLTPEQRKEFRITGNLPKADSAPAAPAKTEGESGTPKQQEKPKNEPKPKQTADERIAQLTAEVAAKQATIDKIREGSEKKTPKADTSAPAKPETVSQSAKPTPEDKKEDGSPKFETHEDYVEALTEWKMDQREAKKALDAAQEAHNKELNDKVEDARSRYGDIDALIQSAANEIYQDPKISPVIKQMIGDSGLIVDLIYTLGNDKAEFAKFTQMAKDNPGKAIRYVALTESLIAQELEAKAKPTEVSEPPAKPRTQAPKPPVEAGGRAATPPDPLQTALEGSGGKLTGALKAEFTRQQLARMK